MAYDPLRSAADLDGLGGGDAPRRTYDVCVVFSYKTRANVRYGDEVDVTNKFLKDAGETEQSVMHMWEMRRNTVVKALQAAGLETKCIYSRDRDEVFCKVGASDEKLQELAQLMKYKLRLKDEYESAYAEYRRDYVGTPPLYEDRRIVSHLFATDHSGSSGGSVFRPVDRIRLIDRCIRSSDKGCAAVDVAEMMRPIQKEQIAAEGLATSGGLCGVVLDALGSYPGAVADYFPLAENGAVAGLAGSPLEVLQPSHKLEAVRDYFGESVAFYWLWVFFMMKAVALLALLGLFPYFIELFTQTPNNFTELPFCLGACLVLALTVHFWRRAAATQALKWGTLDMEMEHQPPRKEFFGEKRINPVTERPELHYPWERRVPAYLMSAGVLGLSVFGLLLMTLMLFTLRHIMHRDFKNPNAPLLFQFINAIIVEVLNAQFSYVAKWLTDNENHRTNDEYQTHLLGKTMVFKFFNSYVSLYYIAFFKGHDTFLGPKLRCSGDDCLVDLTHQLLCFMVVRLILANIWEVIWPKLSSFAKEYYEQRTMQQLVEGSDVMMFAGMSSMELQAKKEKAQMYDEMEELLLSYGYCTLFVVAAPWMPLLTLLGCGLETAIDKLKLFRLYQRPWPLRVGTHEPWDTAFDLMSLVGMATNIALVVFASPDGAFSTYSRTEKLTAFFVLENLVLALRFAVGIVLPARPTEVSSVALKHQVVVQKHLDCVEAVLDGTFYEDTALTGRVNVMDRDEDEEDDEF
jgi:hypothetical protein